MHPGPGVFSFDRVWQSETYLCMPVEQTHVPVRALVAVDARTVISGASLAEVRRDYSYQNCAKYFVGVAQKWVDRGRRELRGASVRIKERGARSERLGASCAAHTDTSRWRGAR